ncbi:MAG: helix-turn-helix transcriptional regulator [Clostridia bacterium]|nr:helix-turn-helix transcriptional regulator [Clostridia bacterium]
MNIFQVIYAMILPIIYIIPIILSVLCYNQRKERDCIAVAVLFGVYILDNLVIFLTEMVPWFSEIYDKTFMYVPTWKTMIYVTSYGCLLYLYNFLIKGRKLYFLCILLFLFTFFQMFVPVMRNSALKVWLYYLPPQIYMFTYSIIARSDIKKAYLTAEGEYKQLLKDILKVMSFCLIFPIFIALEDSYVIFFVDQYTEETFIMNRNNCEDILRIIITVFSSKMMLHLLQTKPAVTVPVAEEIPADAGDNIVVSDIPETIEAVNESSQEATAFAEEAEISEKDTQEKLKLNDFCEHYGLTPREKRVLTLLLDNLTNQEISDTLMVSLGTAKTHTHNIYQKLDVQKRRQMIEVYNNFRA